MIIYQPPCRFNLQRRFFMSDSKLPLNKKDQQRLKEKRGSGTGMNYNPFIHIQELSSTGESIRVKSATVGRLHHLISGIEFSAFLLFDWSNDVLDIREQYPIPLQDSLAICRQLGIRHPQVKGELTIVTTDFLINKKDNIAAFAVKQTTELNNLRTLEKLQIEKTFCEHNHIEWKMFTEKEISPGFKENLKWIKPFLDADTASLYNISPQDVYTLINRISVAPNNLVTRLCAQLDDNYQLPPSYHIEVFRFAIANKYISSSFEIPFHNWSVNDLTINISSADGEVNHVS